MDLLKLARAMDSASQWQTYAKARAEKGSEQLIGALEAANPSLRLRYLNEHPKPGQLVPVVTREYGRDVTRYYGDPKGWMAQFEAPGVPCSIERPR